MTDKELKVDPPDKQVKDFVKNQINRLNGLIHSERQDEERSARRRQMYQAELDQWLEYQSKRGAMK